MSAPRTCAGIVIIGLIFIGCASAAPPAPSVAPSQIAAASEAPRATTAVRSNRPSVPPSPSAVATLSAFTSEVYPYSLTVPGGWSSVAATAPWDGVSGVKSDSPEVDRWISVGSASSWASAAAYAKNLESYVAKTIADTARYHGDTCTAPPEVQEPITVGGEPGALMAWNCGILINIGVTVHNRIGYTFGFRDPAVRASTDPTDHEIFIDLLKSVQFPG
jgi:hypothetical protein